MATVHPFVTENMATLVSMYNANGRHYHNLNHINFCLARMEQALKEEEFAGFTDNELCGLEIAIWFHDVIYNAEAQMVTKGYSEDSSVDFMMGLAIKFCREYQLLEGETWEDFKEQILIAEKLIRATANHGSVPEDKLTALMVDIDLSSLALDWKEFRQNTDDVVLEYALFRDWNTIALGNARFLKGLIDKPIYHTEWGKKNLEEKAQWNIKRRIMEVLPVDEQR
jgi:predicted metal-dependent HD superfamily phosphohydrolase